MISGSLLTLEARSNKTSCCVSTKWILNPHIRSFRYVVRSNLFFIRGIVKEQYHNVFLRLSSYQCYPILTQTQKASLPPHTCLVKRGQASNQDPLPLLLLYFPQVSLVEKGLVISVTKKCKYIDNQFPPPSSRGSMPLPSPNTQHFICLDNMRHKLIRSGPSSKSTY